MLFNRERDLMIRIADDGHGFDVERALSIESSTGKFGLFSVRERMRLLGGDMTLNSNPSHGTQVELRVPSLATGDDA